MGTTTTSDSPQLDISPLDVARIEVVSFDLDGTLLDSRSAWRAGFEAPFARLAQRHPALLTLGDYAHVHDHVFQPFLMAMWERDRGEWTPEYVRGGWRLLLERHATRDDVAADAAFEEYESTWPTLMRLFEESLAVLEAVQARYPMVLLTNGNTTQQRMKIVAHDLERWFQHVVVSEEVGLLKPDPAIFAHAIAPLGVLPNAALHIGDTRSQDVAGARASGWQSAWVNRARVPAEDDHHPDIEIASLDELVALLGLR